MSAPIYVLNKNAEREQGKKAQAANIKAAKVSVVHLKRFICSNGLFQSILMEK